MNDPLDILWASLDTELPVYCGDAVRAWPEGVFEWLSGSELISPADIASHVACPSCPDRHVEEVLSREMPDGSAGFFIACPQCFRVSISMDLLRQWKPNYKLLARRLKEVLGMTGRATERIDERLWRLAAPAVHAALREARRASFVQAIGMTQSYAAVAVSALIKIVQDANASSSARVAGAAVLLKFGREGIELDDLADRIKVLEQRVMPLLPEVIEAEATEAEDAEEDES
ncbi:MAG: hypothetical protein JWO75_2443 [Actinomycetia bacterium]|nr:hypothetical protein [Actinomycetes bacterium]